MSQDLEPAGLERMTEKRKLMQLKLQADLDSNGRVAERRWHVNHFKPVSSVKWGQSHVMLDVTPVSLLFIPVLATEESVKLPLRSPCLSREGEGSRVEGKGEKMPNGWVKAESHAPCPLAKGSLLPPQCLPFPASYFSPPLLSLGQRP